VLFLVVPVVMMQVEMMRRSLADVLAEFAQVVGDGGDVTDILQRLAQYCRELLPVASAGVLIAGSDGGLQVAAAADELGAHAELLERELGYGPSTEAYQRGRQVNVPDLRRVHDRYPAYVPRALEIGVHAVHAFPMCLRNQRVGTLDLLAREPMDLSAGDSATAQLLCDVATSYIVNRQAFDQTSELSMQLQQALDSRVVIEQAKGTIAERFGIGVGEAFDKLRAYSRNTGTKLHVVAQQVLSGELDVR
jgi:transcriptional regulator with GAF, ATPase, and Fis domain